MVYTGAEWIQQHSEPKLRLQCATDVYHIACFSRAWIGVHGLGVERIRAQLQLQHQRHWDRYVAGFAHDSRDVQLLVHGQSHRQ
jgi:hypothetical protein